MNWIQKLAALKPLEYMSKRTIILCILSVSILLCGFTWNWAVGFTARVLFPVENAVDSDLILDFSDIVNIDDLQIYLTNPMIAEQIVQGVQANVSTNVYHGIELPDMTEENLGRKIIRTIFDRVFN